MSNNLRKSASDSDLIILIPLACIVSVVGFIATTLVS